MLVPASGGSRGSTPPAVEFGLTPEGAVTVVSLPLLPDDSELKSESQRLELDPEMLNVQDVLLQAASKYATLHLGMQ